LLLHWQLLIESREAVATAAANLCCRVGNLRLLHWTMQNFDDVCVSMRQCSLAVLEYLLECGLISKRELDFRDLLFAETTTDHFRLYAKYGANPNKHGGRLLRDCAALGLSHVLEFLIAETDASLEQFGLEALIAALRHGHPDVVAILLENGVSGEAALGGREFCLFSPYCLYVSFDDATSAADLRFRASLDRLRMSEGEFYQALDASLYFVDCVREIVARKPGGGSIKYWLEDTPMELEAVQRADDEYEEEDRGNEGIVL